MNSRLSNTEHRCQFSQREGSAKIADLLNLFVAEFSQFTWPPLVRSNSLRNVFGRLFPSSPELSRRYRREFLGLVSFIQSRHLCDVLWRLWFATKRGRRFSNAFWRSLASYTCKRHLPPGIITWKETRRSISAIGQISQLCSALAIMSDPFSLRRSPVAITLFDDSHLRFQSDLKQTANPFTLIGSPSLRRAEVHSHSITGVNRPSDIANRVCSWICEYVDKPRFLHDLIIGSVSTHFRTEPTLFGRASA